MGRYLGEDLPTRADRQQHQQQSKQQQQTTTTTTTITNATMASARVLFEADQLESMAKEDLIALVLGLQQEKRDLVERNDRQNSFEITNNETMEELELFNGAKVEVYGRQLKRKDLAVCHRIGKRGVTC